MQNSNDLKSYLELLSKAGADKAQCTLNKRRLFEINVESDEISLLRTTYNQELNLNVIRNQARGNININQITDSAVKKAARQAVRIAESSQPDEAHDISPGPLNKKFEKGPDREDRNKMYELLAEFLHQVQQKYPLINLEQVNFRFYNNNRQLSNTNNVYLSEQKSFYTFSTMFMAKKGDQTSSFNHTRFSSLNLQEGLLKKGSIAQLLAQSEKQIKTKSIPEKFTGDIIITPDCLSDFINMYINISLRDNPLIEGTSMFADQLEQKAADSKFTLYSRPVDPDTAGGYFITGDGFLSENAVIFKNGVLKRFLLSQYGANKTGREMSNNRGGAYVVEPGEMTRNKMIKTVDRGLLVARFSGGSPNQNGDFSGIAKNSFYIEKGQIKYPVAETMISGNLKNIFNNIGAISNKRINFGDDILPWILTTGITISGGN